MCKLKYVHVNVNISVYFKFIILYADSIVDLTIFREENVNYQFKALKGLYHKRKA